MISIAEVAVDETTQRLVLEVLRSGRLAQGPMVEAFESAFCEATGASHAIAVNSGTAALEATLFALGIGSGDEVITTPLTFSATLNAIIGTGATVRFADIGADYCLDPARVEALCNERTKAVVAVHLYGCPADLGKIAPWLAERGIMLIEDAAQALGASIGSHSVGTIGHGCFSFYASKTLTTGEGGMVTTSDAGVAERVRLLRNQGMATPYEYLLPGRNLRMPELSAALGVAQMPHVDPDQAARRENAAVLSEALASIEGIVLPLEPPGRTHAYSLYTVQMPERCPLSRDAAVQSFRAKAIGASVYYPRTVSDYPCYRGLDTVQTDPVPHAEHASRRVISLPVHARLSPNDLDRVATTACEVLGLQ